MLPFVVQQQLDQMTPKEFLNYVLRELTLEERESLMVDEGQRRRTFLVNWSYDGCLSGVRMAQAGFYYVGDADRVQCVFCRGCLHKWETNDNPMTEHARSFTFCRFVKGLECGNREYRSSKLSKDGMQNITTFDNSNTAGQRRSRNAETDGGVYTNRAAMIRYAPGYARLTTFSRWPASNLIDGQQLCDARSYYIGLGDQVRCFIFFLLFLLHGPGVEDPWEEHARWFPDCSYLINQKGKSYVDEVHDRTPDKKTVRKTKSQKNAEQKQITHRSTQEEMIRCCRKLGHSDQLIDRAIAMNGKPFDNVKTMIDVLYSLEKSTINASPASEQKCIQNDNHSGRFYRNVEDTISLSSRQCCKRKTPSENFHYKHDNKEPAAKRQMVNWEQFNIFDEWKSHTPTQVVNDLTVGYSENPRPFTDAWTYTAVHYSDSYFTQLPPLLIQTLNTMNANDYLQYVLKEMTVEKRKLLMADEKQRRKTFRTGWPHAGANGSLSGAEMARAGFYYVNKTDQVQCAFCDNRLDKWGSEEDDSPLEEHRRLFTSCPFALGRECGNREFKVNMDLSHLKFVTIYNSDLRNIAKTNHDDVEDVCNMLAIGQSRAAHISYAPISRRSQTFATWSDNHPIRPYQLWDAGFYYTGIHDNVRCFYCSGSVKEWSAGDDPWEEHARWFPECAFLIYQKGIGYIMGIYEQTPSHKKSKRKPYLPKQAQAKQTRHNTALGYKCRRCKDEIANHLGLPCGHFAYCTECNDIEESLSLASDYEPVCVDCEANLSGSQRFFLA